MCFCWLENKKEENFSENNSKCILINIKEAEITISNNQKKRKYYRYYWKVLSVELYSIVEKFSVLMLIWLKVSEIASFLVFT